MIIDRRKNDKGKNLGNKQRFLRRVKETIRKNAHKLITDKMGNEKTSETIAVSNATVEEPSFRYDNAAQYTAILPGNYKYVKGDVFDIQDMMHEDQGKGKGQGGNGGGGEDDFVVNVSRDEFLDYFFDDLELPNLEKTNVEELKAEKFHRAGYAPDGPPSRLSIVRTAMRAKMRRIALSAPYSKKIKELEALLEETTNEDERNEILEQIRKLKIRAKAITFIEPATDLRFKQLVPQPKKHASAVIFFVMDNSGSMGEREKRIGRKFFTLFYLFVMRKYQDVSLVFISHTDKAREVTEEEFFNTRESGGTQVSPAIELIQKIIAERFNSRLTNIYVSHVSDGDNYSQDNPATIQEMKKLMHHIQFFTYVQVEPPRDTQYFEKELWEAYETVYEAEEDGKMAMTEINDDEEIYGVFRDIFAKRD